MTGVCGLCLEGKHCACGPSLVLWVVLVLDPNDTGSGSVPALDEAVLQSIVARPRAEA